MTQDIGSSPVDTIIRGVRLKVRTVGFHPANDGSIPSHPAKHINTSQDGADGSSLGS